MDKNTSYLQKENYITVNSDPSLWRNHANFFIMQAAKDIIHGRCADLGCNHGSCTLLLLDFDTVESIHGFDINYSALQVAYNTALQLNVNKKISFLCANLTSLPIENNYFNFVMSFHTLEHIYPEDANSVVKEMYRILMHNGHVLVSIPYERAYPDPAHVSFYNETTLKSLFEQNNFMTVYCFKDDRFDQKDLLTACFKKL